jgi:5'-3' exoribonuclease 1
MGIPSYFSYIVKNHSKILRKYSDFLQYTKINNFYLDSNSIVYDCLRKIKYTNKIEFEKKLINDVCKKIIEYILIIKPDNTIYIAFDGVAPLAKMNQQKNRRYKSHFEKSILQELDIYKNESWDKTAITPGTNFMKKLNNKVQNYFKNHKKFGVENIIISGSDIPGEGEHKLFDHIKHNKEMHKHTQTVVYGLDADLIMLAINHLPISNNIYLFRETPEFIKSIDKSLNPNENYILDIPLLASTLTLDLNNNKIVNNTQKKNKLYDYIFICFLLGNDFLPHFPALNIRTNGIDKILSAYKSTIVDKNITDGKQIFWNQFRKFIQYLADKEHDFIKKEYVYREKRERRTLPSNTPEQIMKKYLHTPLYNREKEIFINPFEDYWEQRYYTVLFNIHPTKENIKHVCINYLEGLEWCIKYYTTGCPDWLWKYNYHYPPLLSDLIKYIPYFNTEMILPNNNIPVSPYTQLSYVLPPQSLHLLPRKICNYLLNHKKNYYLETCDIETSFCTYIWESHCDFPECDILELESCIKSLIQ